MTVDAFLKRLIVLYGVPESTDDEAFLNEYRDLLKGVDPRILKAAGDYIRNTHERRSWPTPAEVRKAMSHAVAQRPLPPSDLNEPDEFEQVGPEDDRFVRTLTAARVDNPAYAAMIEKRGFIKVRRRPIGPRKGAVSAVVTDITKRMTGERD